LRKGNKQQSQILNGAKCPQLRGIQGIRIEPQDIDIAQHHPEIRENGGLYALEGYFSHKPNFTKIIGKSIPLSLSLGLGTFGAGSPALWFLKKFTDEVVASPKHCDDD
jgi:hypothetical protein